jgi:hypothetical protein
MATDSTNVTTTLATPPDLQFSMGAGESWIVQGTAQIAVDASGSFGFQFTAPAGATSQILFEVLTATDASFSKTHKAVNTLTNLTPGVSGDIATLTFFGTVTNGSAPGAFALQFARFGSTSITVKAGSGILGVH